MGYIGAAASTSSSPPMLPRRLVDAYVADADARATLINVNFPGARSTGVEVTRLGKRIYDDELRLLDEPDETAASATRSTAGRPATRRPRGPTSPRSPRGGSRSRRSTSTSPTTVGSERLRGWGLEETARHLDAGRMSADGSSAPRARPRPSAPRSCARSSTATTASTTSSTTPRSATTSTTSC